MKVSGILNNGNKGNIPPSGSEEPHGERHGEQMTRLRAGKPLLVFVSTCDGEVDTRGSAWDEKGGADREVIFDVAKEREVSCNDRPYIVGQEFKWGAAEPLQDRRPDCIDGGAQGRVFFDVVHP